MKNLVFIGATGRSGTMTLANILALSKTTLSLHEGMSRERTMITDRVLPHLTLQNLHAYHEPEAAANLFRNYRYKPIIELETKKNIVDTAYFYAPFIDVIPQFFPNAKFVIITRDGRDFVRSAYTSTFPDPMPIGFTDEHALSNHERYVSLGRLKPREGTVFSHRWPGMTPFEKNCWLWANTNEILVAGMKKWPTSQIEMFKFESLISNPIELKRLLDFIEIDDISESDCSNILSMKINANQTKVLPPYSNWKTELTLQFDQIAGKMMKKLGYS